MTIMSRRLPERMAFKGGVPRVVRKVVRRVMPRVVPRAVLKVMPRAVLKDVRKG